LSKVFVRVHFRYDRDPYAAELEAFARFLIEHGYSNKAARGHLYCLQQVLHRVGNVPGATLGAASLSSAFQAYARRRHAGYSHTKAVYLPFLRATGRLLDPPVTEDPVTSIVDGFVARLSTQRGLRSSTCAGYRYWILDYLHRMLQPGEALVSLRAGMLEQYVAKRAGSLAPCTMRTAINCIQSFLRDCIARRLVAPRADALDRPRSFRDDRPPRALPWPMIRRLLASVDRSTAAGRRDYAILHLMAYYGLRPGEVGAMMLDSVDWQAGLLTIAQPKTGSTLVLPLHDRTRRILLDYLDSSRQASRHTAFFLTAHAPVQPMSKFALSFIFKTHARRSGLPVAHASSYSLRHAFAMRLFARGVGMKAIGDLMGHRSLVSTSVYIRLQADVLREVALPVPRPLARGTT
jgi:integrase